MMSGDPAVPGTLQSTEWMSKDGCTSSTSAWTPGCSVASSRTCQPLIRFSPKFSRRSRWKWRREKLWKLDAEATSTRRQRPSARAPSRALAEPGSAFRQQQHSAAFSSAMAPPSPASGNTHREQSRTRKQVHTNPQGEALPLQLGHAGLVFLSFFFLLLLSN